MGKSKFTINMDYQNVIRQKNNIGDIAEKINAERQKLEGIRMQTANKWKGEESEKYISMLQKKEAELRDISSQIKNLTGIIQTMAETVRDAELYALEKANDRDY